METEIPLEQSCSEERSETVKLVFGDPAPPSRGCRQFQFWALHSSHSSWSGQVFYRSAAPQQHSCLFSFRKKLLRKYFRRGPNPIGKNSLCEPNVEEIKDDSDYRIVVLDCGCSNSQREYVGWLCCEPQTGAGSIPGRPWGPGCSGSCPL